MGGYDDELKLRVFLARFYTCTDIISNLFFLSNLCYHSKNEVKKEKISNWGYGLCSGFEVHKGD